MDAERQHQTDQARQPIETQQSRRSKFEPANTVATERERSIGANNSYGSYD